MPVLQSRVGVFALGSQGTGQAAIVNEDGTVNSPSRPADRGSIVSIYATGTGIPEPVASDDRVAGDGLSAFKSLVSVALASDPSNEELPSSVADILYYGPAPRLVSGMAQINARVPHAPTGDAVALVFRDASGLIVEQTLTIAIR